MCKSILVDKNGMSLEYVDEYMGYSRANQDVILVSLMEQESESLLQRRGVKDPTRDNLGAKADEDINKIRKGLKPELIAFLQGCELNQDPKDAFGPLNPEEKIVFLWNRKKEGKI